MHPVITNNKIEKKFFISKRAGIIFLISLIISLFLFFELKPSLEVPDISFDEGMADSVAVFLLDNTAINPFGWKEIVFLGRHYPLTSTGYMHGVLEDFLIFPAVKFFGIQLWSLRIIPVFFGVLIIILTYLAGSRLFSPAVGIIASLLLVLNPFYMRMIRSGPEYGFSLPLFCLFPLLFFWKYFKDRQNRYIFLGMFFLGLGLNVKGFFVWFIFGFLLSTLFCYYNDFRKINFRTACLAILSFFVGALPILYYYLQGNILINVMQRNFHVTHNGYNNLLILQHLALRLQQLNYVLSGGSWKECFWRNTPFFIFCLSYLYILISIIFRKDFLKRKPALHILLIFLSVSIVSVYSFTDLYPTHWYVLIPYLQFIIAIAIVDIFKQRKFLAKIFAAVLLVTSLAHYTQFCIVKYQELCSEKKNMRACSIKDLTGWLLDNKYYNCTSFNPEIYFGLRIFSNLKMCNRDFRFWTDADRKKNTYSFLKSADKEAVYIMPYPGLQTDDKYFQEALGKLKQEVFVIKDFICPDTGKTKFKVFILRNVADKG
jgi:hypothetical protein